MNLKADIEIEEKINECIQNRSRHVEWLCQNKTEKQLEQLLKRLEKLHEFAVREQIAKHVELINLWKEEITVAMKNLANFENLYVILKKMNKKKKIISYERMFVDFNYDWFYNRIYDLPDAQN
jgi:hypothetical protein